MNKQPKHFDEEIFILERLRFGDKSAMKQIFDLYWHRLHQTAVRKLGSEELAKFAVKTVFETLWDKKEVLLINDLSDYLFSSLKLTILELSNKSRSK